MSEGWREDASNSRPWNATVLRPGDNVAMVLAPVAAGEAIAVEIGGTEANVRAREPIAINHKVALAPIRCGETVIKYGECIGEASQDIAAGAWVHVHNLRSRRARSDGGLPAFDAEDYARATAAALALSIPPQSRDAVAANLLRLHDLARELLDADE